MSYKNKKVKIKDDLPGYVKKGTKGKITDVISDDPKKGLLVGILFETNVYLCFGRSALEALIQIL